MCKPTSMCQYVYVSYFLSLTSIVLVKCYTLIEEWQKILVFLSHIMPNVSKEKAIEMSLNAR
jgi:hypothetical protein